MVFKQGGYAGASGGVAMWYEYHSNPKKVSANMTI